MPDQGRRAGEQRRRYIIGRASCGLSRDVDPRALALAEDCDWQRWRWAPMQAQHGHIGLRPKIRLGHFRRIVDSPTEPLSAVRHLTPPRCRHRSGRRANRPCQCRAEVASRWTGLGPRSAIIRVSAAGTSCTAPPPAPRTHDPGAGIRHPVLDRARFGICASARRGCPSTCASIGGLLCCSHVVATAHSSGGGGATPRATV